MSASESTLYPLPPELGDPYADLAVYAFDLNAQLAECNADKRIIREWADGQKEAKTEDPN